MKNLMLVSTSQQSKKEKRDKLKKLYSWRIIRYDPGVELKFAMDVSPKQPKDYGIQLRKVEFLSEINSRNIFDFALEFQDDDILSLQNIRDSDDFLNLCFHNGMWSENTRYTISNRDQVIRNGIFELTE